MKKFKNFINQRPRLFVISSFITVVFLFGIIIFSVINQNSILNSNIRSYTNTDGIKVSTPISSSLQTPIETPQTTPEPILVPPQSQNPEPQSITPPQTPYVGTVTPAPVMPLNCNPGEDSFVNAYYSFCYPDTMQLTPGQQGGEPSPSYLVLTDSMNSLPEQFIMENIDSRYSMSYHKAIERGDNNLIPQGSFIDPVAAYMKTVTQKSASSLSNITAFNFKAVLPGFSYKYIGSKVDLFSASITNYYPSDERKVLMFRNGNLDYIAIYQDNSVTQRILESLVFNQ